MQDQAMKLRANSTVQELVDAFKVARPAVLKVGQNFEGAKDGIGKTKKRKIDDTDMEEDENEDEQYADDSLRRRKTRSRNRRRSTSNRMDNDHTIYSGRDGDFELGGSARSIAFEAINTKFVPRGRLDRVSHLWGEDEGGSSLYSFGCTQQLGLYDITSEVDTPMLLIDK